MEDTVRDLVARWWGLHDAKVETREGSGISSETWRISSGGKLWIAKAVPIVESSVGLGFELGLEVAEALADSGFHTGRPTRTVQGDLVAPLDDLKLALLHFEEGRPFTVTDLEEARRLGTHLAQLHLGLQRLPHGWGAWDPGAELVDQPYVELRRGLLEVAVEVVEATLAAVAGSMTGLIHGDLDADEILISPAGSIAIVDWGSVQIAPLVLELFAFHDQDCFSALVAGYTAIRPEAEVELRASAELERLHWLRQTAFWGTRVIKPFRDAEQKQGYTNQYGFERSYEILTTGRWRP